MTNVAAEVDSRQSRGVADQILGDLARYFPSNLLPGVGFLVGILIFTRSFAPAPYGLYIVAMAIASPVIGLLTQWVLRPAMRFYAEYRSHGHADVYQELMSTLNIRLMLLVTMLALASSIPTWLTGWLPHHWVLASGVFLFVLGSVPATNALAVVRSSLRPASFFGVAVVSEIVSIGVPLILVFTVSRDVGWLAWGQALSVWIALPYTLSITGITPRMARLRLSTAAHGMLTRFARYGTPMVLWWAGANLLSIEDRYVLAAYKGSAQVALYGVNYDLITAAAALLNGTIILGFGPALYHHWAAGRKQEVQAAIAQTTDVYFFLGACFVGGVITIGPAVENILVGPDFRAGLLLLVPVAVGMVFFGLGLIGHKCLELGEGTFAMASGAAIAGIANLALNLLLVPHYGYVASADITALCYGLYAALIWWQSRRFVHWNVRLSTLAQAIVVVAVAAAVGCLLMSWMRGAGSIRIPVSASVYLAVFALLAAAAQPRLVSANLPRFLRRRAP